MSVFHLEGTCGPTGYQGCDLNLDLLQLSLFKPVQRPPVVSDTALMVRLQALLQAHVPAGCLDNAAAAILEFPVDFTIVGGRQSKLGDYRPATRLRRPRITVNSNLNPFAFLVTLLHELAHHHVHLEHQREQQRSFFRRKRTPLPHGEEWKSKFREVAAPFLDPLFLPPDILTALRNYLENPRATSSADGELSAAIKKYDPPDNTRRLEELPFDALFSLQGRRIFRKKEKVRTRYRCVCQRTNRIYLISPVAPVMLIPE